MRNQQEAPGSRVIDRLRHCGDHVAGQVRLDARDQRPGDHRSRHHLIRRCGHLQIAGITGFRGSSLLERLLLVLPVLHGGGVGRLGRRRSRPGRHRVEVPIGGEARRGGHLRLRRRRGLLGAGAEEYRRCSRFLGLLQAGHAFRLGRVVTGCGVGGHGRLLRIHDGRPKVARQRRPQLGHLWRQRRRQLRVVSRKLVESFGA